MLHKIYWMTLTQNSSYEYIINGCLSSLSFITIKFVPFLSYSSFKRFPNVLNKSYSNYSNPVTHNANLKVSFSKFIIKIEKYIITY